MKCNKVGLKNCWPVDAVMMNKIVHLRFYRQGNGFIAEKLWLYWKVLPVSKHFFLLFLGETFQFTSIFGGYFQLSLQFESNFAKQKLSIGLFYCFTKKYELIKFLWKKSSQKKEQIMSSANFQKSSDKPKNKSSPYKTQRVLSHPNKNVGKKEVQIFVQLIWASSSCEAMRRWK